MCGCVCRGVCSVCMLYCAYMHFWCIIHRASCSFPHWAPRFSRGRAIMLIIYIYAHLMCNLLPHWFAVAWCHTVFMYQTLLARLCGFGILTCGIPFRCSACMPLSHGCFLTPTLPPSIFIDGESSMTPSGALLPCAFNHKVHSKWPLFALKYAPSFYSWTVFY
jgi:hypothetical protein